MLSIADQEVLVTAGQNARDLVQNLQKLTQSENPLLADVILDLISGVSVVDQRLARLNLVTHSEQAAA